MSDVNPFEAPPLVEWDNCVTHQELHEIQYKFRDFLGTLKWYQIIQRHNTKTSINTIGWLILWVHDGKRIEGGCNEQAS